MLILRIPENNLKRAAIKLEYCKRVLNRRATDKLNPHFHLNSVDFRTLIKLYPDHLPSEVAHALSLLSSNEIAELPIFDSFQMNVGSNVFTIHPSVDRYNELYADYNSGALSKEVYKGEIEKLKWIISEDIRERFIKAISFTPKLSKQLLPQAETLLLVCLYFYNTMWDTFGETFNGPVAVTNGMEDLLDEFQPYDYRGLKQAQFIATMIEDYYAKPSRPESLNVVVRSKDHTTTDPVMIDWIVKDLIQKLKQRQVPITMGIAGEVLGAILNRMDEDGKDIFLSKLKTFNEWEAPTHVDEKRKVVKEYCLSIHKAFSHYLQLPVETFDGGRLKVYHNILLAFEMDDFSKAMRTRTVETKPTVNRDLATSRLGELLRRKDDVQVRG